LNEKIIFNGAMLTATIGLLLFGLTASVANAQWVVEVIGAVDNPFSFTVEDLAAMPQTEVNATLLCDGAYVASGLWTGVRLGYLLEQAEYRQGAASIAFYAQDGYSSNLPIHLIHDDNIIVAYEFEGQPLPETLRLVVPGMNGEFWIAWLTSIKVSTDPYTSAHQDMNPPPATTSRPPRQNPTMPTPPPPSQNKTSTQSTSPSADSQTLQQTEVSSSSGVPAEYGYPLIFAAAASTISVIGYIAYDWRKDTNKKADFGSHQAQA
jgi:DMSO/TMAO reductase YedYZ molybdopterin-dependent catalytic subunit